MKIKLITALIAFGLVAGLISMSANSSPCSCWDGGMKACQTKDSSGIGCSKCWAAFDTGVFSPSFSLDEVKKVKAEIDKLFGGAMSEENWNKAKEAVATATGVPIKAIWDPSFYVGSFIGAGVDAMENCRKACQSVNKMHNLNQSVWWYADTTALNSCKDFATRSKIDIINKYDYKLQ